MHKISWLAASRYKLVSAAMVSAIVTFSGAAFFVSSPTALAASHTLYVGHGVTGNDSSCSAPGYNSVQTAVNAAGNNYTVYLCGAPFAEQVFVDKSITLTGDSTSGLTAVGTTFATTDAPFPAKFSNKTLFVPQALLVVAGASTNAAVNYLTISGPMPGNGSCAEEEYGVLALAGNLNMYGDQVTNIGDTNTSLSGCQFGVGIQVGREYWPPANFGADDTVNFAATATIKDVTVSGYDKNGITVDGNGSAATISDSTVTGGGTLAPFGPDVAQNGIQISRGAGGSVKDSSISGNSYTGAGFASSAGILLFGGCGDPLVTGVTLRDNTFAGNDVGIDMADYNKLCTAAPAAATNDQASDNVLSDSAVTNISGLCDGSVACGGLQIGYQAGIADVGNSDTVTDNELSGVGYQAQGTYNYKVSPAVFTQTGANAAFVAPVDAGGSFYDTNAKVKNNFWF